MKQFSIAFISFLFFITSLFTLSFLVIYNLTPRQLGLSNLSVADISIENTKLADIKLCDIYRYFAEFLQATESFNAFNSFDEYDGLKTVNSNLKGSFLENESNFSSLLSNKLLYRSNKILTYSDSSLAFIFDNVLKNSFGENGLFDILPFKEISVKEISITCREDTFFFKIVCLVNLSDSIFALKKNLQDNYSFLKIPDEIYFTSNYIMNVDEKGKANFAPIDFIVNNGSENIINESILNLIISETGADSEYELNSKIGEFISNVLFNLGSIGSAERNTSSENADEYFVCGISGISDNKITIITHIND